MKNYKRIFLIALLVLLLFFVRGFAQRYFYDPFIIFFKQDHLYERLPTPEWDRFYLFLTFRYWLNSILSIGIIYMLFPKLENLKFVAKLYLVAFLFFGISFTILLQTSTSGNYMALFYVRRFLIHPVLLLVLIPAFYYKEIHLNEKETKM